MRSPEPPPPKRACHGPSAGTPGGAPLEDRLATRVAEVAVAKYQALPKTGKPQGHEHTVMCAFVLSKPTEEAEASPLPGLSCVALGTGTKCLSGQQRSPHGDLLNDMHAEAVARRALLRWLLAHMERAFAQPSPAPKDEDAVLEPSPHHPGTLQMRAGFQLHMYISATPCGDAAVFDVPDPGEGPHQEGWAEETQVVAAHRTGAKSVIGSDLLPQQSDVEATQVAGHSRRKPGRGAATLSMSCSDKIARWCLLGLQGSMLSAFLAHPIRPATVAVAAPSAIVETGPRAMQALETALHRALVGRCECLKDRLSESLYGWAPPAVVLLDPPPPALRICLAANSGADTVPSGVSINYSAAAQKSLVAAMRPAGSADGGVHEVTQRNGRKAGAGKKAKASAKTISTLARAHLLGQVTQVLTLRGDSPDTKRSYREAKLSLGAVYQSLWQRLREEPSPFSCWIAKPDGHDGFSLPDHMRGDGLQSM